MQNPTPTREAGPGLECSFPIEQLSLQRAYRQVSLETGQLVLGFSVIQDSPSCSSSPWLISCKAAPRWLLDLRQAS